MIEIRNITLNNSISVKTSYSGSRDAPLHITLRPGENLVLADDQLKLYDGGPRQNLAELVAKKLITMTQNDGVHTYQDKGHIPTYPNWCAQGGNGTPLVRDCVPTVIPPVLMTDTPDCNPYCLPILDWSPTSDGLAYDDVVIGLQQAINAFDDLLATYNAHALDSAFHTTAGIVSTALNPTNLATLITQLGILRANYLVHIAAGALHPTPDTWNVLPAWVLVTLDDCVDAIRQFTMLYNSHRLQYEFASILTPLQVLTY